MYSIVEARRLNEMAREMFLRDGGHKPTMLMFAPGVKECKVVDIAVFMAMPKGKDVLSAMVKRLASSGGITGVAIITEAWLTSVDDPEDAARVERGEASVADLGTKKEVLMVKAESDDGLDVLFANRIVREGSGVRLGEPEVIRGAIGRLGGFFAPQPEPEQPRKGSWFYGAGQN